MPVNLHEYSINDIRFFYGNGVRFLNRSKHL
jgi:hypothetical protein